MSSQLTRANRLYARLYRRMVKGMGYQSYGYDWRTLNATRPALCKAMRKTLTIIQSKENRNNG